MTINANDSFKIKDRFFYRNATCNECGNKKELVMKVLGGWICQSCLYKIFDIFLGVFTKETFKDSKGATDKAIAKIEKEMKSGYPTGTRYGLIKRNKLNDKK